MRHLSASMFVLGAFTAVTIAAQQNPMRPGRWQVTVQMQMANMQMPATTTTQCVTAEQLAKDPGAGLPSGSQPGAPNACKTSNYKVSGNTVTWSIECSGQMAMTGNGELTFMGDSYDGAMKMTMQQGAMTMKLGGKRLGDCAP